MTEKSIGKLSADDVASASVMVALAHAHPFTSANEILDAGFRAVDGLPREELTYEQLMGGQLAEPLILREMGNRLGLPVETGITERVEHATLPLQGSLDGVLQGDGRIVSSIDGIRVVDGAEIALDGPGVAAAKLTSALPRDVPDIYRGPTQVQALMMCTGYTWAAIGTLYRGTQLLIYIVRPDAAAQAKIAADAKDFKRRIDLYRDTGERDWYPLMTANDAGIIWPEPDEDITPVTLEGGANEAALGLIRAKAARRQADKEIEAATLRIQERMGSSQIAIVQDQGEPVAEIRWPMSKARSMYVVPDRPASRSKSLRVKVYGDK